MLDVIVGLVDELHRVEEVSAVGVGAAGFVDASGAKVVFAPHLPWRDLPVRDLIAERVGLPVILDNDANMAAWGEQKFGAAQSASDFVMVNVGTGIGGGIMIAGRPYRGAGGMAGEFGHHQVVPAGCDCECGNRGCWEQYASGRVLERRAQREISSATAMGRDLLAVAGVAEQVSGATVGELAMVGHQQAMVWVAEVGDWLGRGLANLAAALDPEIFVIGGGVSANGDLLLEPARQAFAEHLSGRGHRSLTPIVKAQLGPEAGMIGAADRARSECRAVITEARG